MGVSPKVMAPCHQCGGPSKVDTIRVAKGVTQRLRECSDCGNRWLTREVYVRTLLPRVKGVVLDARDAPVVPVLKRKAR